MPNAFADLSGSVLLPLAIAAVRAIVLASMAGFGMAAFRMKSTSVRLFTWTTVLYAALAMPFLEQMLPAVPFRIPVFLQQPTERRATPAVADSRPAAGVSVIAKSTSLARIVPHTAGVLREKQSETSSIQWYVLASAIYLAGVLLLFGRVLMGLFFGRRLRRASSTIRDSRFADKLAQHAQSAGLSRVPEAAESAFISVPVTMGVLRPIVFLPATWSEWEDAKLDAVIAHELSHVARRDTLTQRLSILHCAIFWFSPLAWWLRAHLADLMEQASDEAALASGADRKVYATTLLEFFATLQRTQVRVWWQGVAMADARRAGRRAEQRVEQILDWKGLVAMNIKKSMAVVVIGIAIPVVYLSAAVHPAGPIVESQGSQRIKIAQNQASPSQPLAAPSPHAQKKSSKRGSYTFSDGDNQSFVIVTGNSDSLTMSGTRMDGEHVEELRKKIPGDFIWFRRNGKSYVIRDQATVNRAKAFWAPQEELGKKQEELGKQQEALGKQQEALSGKMEQVRVKVPDMTKELEQLQATLKKFNSDATMEQIGQIQSEIGELQSKIGDLQSAAGEQQSKVGEEMGALGEKQGKLGEQQGELGRRQGELAEKAQQQTKQLLDESITKGIAQLEQ